MLKAEEKRTEDLIQLLNEVVSENAIMISLGHLE
jgi:hypothetical protein